MGWLRPPLEAPVKAPGAAVPPPPGVWGGGGVGGGGGGELGLETLWQEHKVRVFENGLLEKIFGPKRNEVIEQWRRVHNAELYYLYPSPGIIRVIRSRGMGWAEGMWHVLGPCEVNTGFWWGDMMERYHLEDLGVDGRIILKVILKKWDGEA